MSTPEGIPGPYRKPRRKLVKPDMSYLDVPLTVLDYIGDLEQALKDCHTDLGNTKADLSKRISDEGWRQSAEHAARTGGTL